MPRNGFGVYSKPAGTTAVPNTTIESAKYNQLLDDIAADLNVARPIVAGGTGATTASAARTALGFSADAANFGVKGADIASAATTDLSAATGDYITITGTTTITALGTSPAGTRRFVRFAGVLTLTYNATSLILPGSASIITTAGDTAIFVSEGAGNWRCLDYNRAELRYTGILNKLINPRFNVNTIATVLTTLPAGQHWYDGWKGGPSGCTLSIAAGVVTITAGNLVQVIDGSDIETGTHVINWTGTATCTVDAVAKTKGQTAALTRGTNCTVSFGTGTLSFPQLEPGSVATAFEQRPLALEEALCQTRLELVIAVAGGYQPIAGVNFTTPLYFKKKRATPVVTQNATIVSTNAASSTVDNIFNVGARYVLVGNGSAGVSVFAVLSFFVDARL